jgi:CspA family cold shock protein
MPTGTVKWFNNAKGYGFILPSDSEVDVFAHYSAISMDGYRTLKAGQMVSFDLVDGDKGQLAENIAPVLDPDVEASASEIGEEGSGSDSDSEEPPTGSESALVDAES